MTTTHTTQTTGTARKTPSTVPVGADHLRDEDPAPARVSRANPLGPVASWVDERTGAAGGLRYLMKKTFPDHWSFMLGEIAMYSMIVCLLTGVFLTLWFIPSAGHTVYNGEYEGMRGIGMSEAYKSTLDISFGIKGGLLIRQIHHWAALMFIVAIMLHMFRVFFTGAFRKPREINWIIGCVLSMLALVEGFAGYSLPDDLLSGTGLRAAQGFMLSIPVVGSYISYMLFGGGFPGEMIIPRLYMVHVLLLPAILLGLFGAHLMLVMVHKHTQYPGPGRTNNNVVGFPLMPVYTAKAGGFFFIVFGLITLIASLVSINPIWNYGPYEPTQVTAGSQPDFYMWFADGALRLLPGWTEFELFNTTWSFNIFLGAILLIPLLFGLAMAYPFIEAAATGDKREHHLLDLPHNAPTRTAIGMMAISSYLVMALAAANDLMAVKLGVSINDVTNVLRVAFFLLPPLVFWVTKRICLSLQRRDRDLVLHGRPTGRNYVTPDGGIHGVHEPLSDHDRWNLVSYSSYAPREGSRLSRFFFEDRIEPVTPAELAAAADHGDHHGPAVTSGARPTELH